MYNVKHGNMTLSNASVLIDVSAEYKKHKIGVNESVNE